MQVEISIGNKGKYQYYLTGIARLHDEWSGHGATGEEYLDVEHDYASDLDLFGEGSLFQLINASRTRLGKDKLAEWLCHGVERNSIIERQDAVARLRNEIDLREQLAILTVKKHEDFDQNRLLQWSAQAPEKISSAARVIAVAISVATILAGLGAAALGWSLLPFWLLLAVAIGLLLVFKSQIASAAA